MPSEKFLAWLRPLLNQELQIDGVDIAAISPTRVRDESIILSQNPFVMESRLLNMFPRLLRKHTVDEVMVPVAGRKPFRPEAFKLLPLLRQEISSSLKPSGFVDTPPHVRLYDALNLYLDTRQAVGLTYDDWLIAVAAAGLNMDNGVLVITQLQDVTDIRKKGGVGYYQTGLHNGFLWRDTLVTVWERIAADINANAVVIQSHKNNHWATVRANGRHAYDGVAARMQYTQLLSNDWVKLL